MMEATVREARLTDIGEMSRLWARFAKETFPEGKPDREIWARQTIDFWERGTYVGVVVEGADGVLVGFGDGFLGVDPSRGDRVFFFVRHGWLAPEWRGTGLGGRMCGKALAMAKERGADRVSISRSPGVESVVETFEAVTGGKATQTFEVWEGDL